MKKFITNLMKLMVTFAIAVIGAILMISLVFAAAIKEQDKLASMAAVEVQE